MFYCERLSEQIHISFVVAENKTKFLIQIISIIEALLFLFVYWSKSKSGWAKIERNLMLFKVCWSLFDEALSRLFFQAYLVDYYVYSSSCFQGEPPNHIGFSYILPSTLQASVGLITVPITSTKHRPIGKYVNIMKHICKGIFFSI